jgi:hypothetical protein
MANKIFRDGYGAWIENPVAAVRKAVRENIMGVFLNADGTPKAPTKNHPKQAASKTNSENEVQTPIIT